MFSNTIADNLSYSPISPQVTIRSRYIFFFFSYILVSTLLLSIILIIKCHPIFSFVLATLHFVVLVLLWGKLGKMAYDQNSVTNNP